MVASRVLAMHLPPARADLPFAEVLSRLQALLAALASAPRGGGGYARWWRAQEVWELDAEGVPVRRHDARTFDQQASEPLPGGRTPSVLPAKERRRLFERHGASRREDPRP